MCRVEAVFTGRRVTVEGVRDLGARLNVRGVEQPLVAGLYVDAEGGK